MFPKTEEFINIDVVYLNYNPARDPSNPSIEYEGNCLAGLTDLHNHYMKIRRNRNLIPVDLYKQFLWYNSILQEELHEAPSGYRIQVFHWRIESGICDAFRVKNMQFHSVTMIIGPNTEYWYGINSSRNNGFTKRGRYPRSLAKKPKVPNLRPSLPQCSIIVSSCNLSRTNLCNCFSKSVSGQCVQWIDDELALNKLNELIGIVVKTADDTDDDGIIQDILLFRLCLAKYTRTEALYIKQLQSKRRKLNVRSNYRSRLTSITESEDEN